MSVTVAMAPNSQIQLTIPEDFDEGGRWSLHDDEAGTLSCVSPNTASADGSQCSPNNRARVYSHGSRVGIQKVVYSASDGSYCICNIVTVVPHDHSDIYRGGPAYGVYKSD